jgi:inosose dehydratase
MSSKITLATGPVTWGVDFADSPGNPPWQQVLDELARSGIGALELGPIGYLPEQPERLCAELSSRHLTAVGSFLFEDLHDPAQQERIVSFAGRASKVISAAGGDTVVVIDRPGDERAATAGRSQDARRLGQGEWQEMLTTITRIGRIAADHGLRTTVHPHAGSYIEFPDEIERLLADCDLPLCLDTGHAAYAGMRPEDALIAFAPRLAHVHLKDVNRAVLGRIQGGELPFWPAIAAGVFCPLGSGIVDFGAVAAALRHIGYEGFATIEQDRLPGSGAPLDDLRQCISTLRRAGIGAHDARHEGGVP